MKMTTYKLIVSVTQVLEQAEPKEVDATAAALSIQLEPTTPALQCSDGCHAAQSVLESFFLKKKKQTRIQ